MTLRPRIDEIKIEELKEYYKSKNQTFKNDTHMVQYIIDSFIAGNHIELLQGSELLDNTIREIIDTNVKEFSENIIGNVLNPLRDLAVHSTMIINLLTEEICVGMTDNEKAIRIAEVKKEALKAMAVDGGIQSLYSINSNE